MGPSLSPPLFFISYAHDSGGDDEHVDRFYRDLNHDVLMFAGSRAETAGFCDVSFRLGQRWSRALVESLSTAQVFIPILTPAYFGSEACGKEWTIFESRLARGDRLESAESSIIPLLWIPVAVPSIAQPYQFKETAFGAAYQEVMLRALVRESRYGDDYKAFVQKLAQRVVELGRTAPIAPAPDRPGFGSVPSAFAVVPEPRPATGGGAAKPPGRDRRSSSPAHRPILNTNLNEDT